MTLFTRTASDSVAVSETVARVVALPRGVADSVPVAESVYRLGPTINFAVPVAALPATAGLVPTETVDASLSKVVPTAVGALATALAPTLVLGSTDYIFAVDDPVVTVSALLPALVIGSPIPGDAYGAPIVMSGLTGSGTFDLKDATLEAGELAAFVPALFAALGAHSIWLRWTAPDNGTLTFTVNDAVTTDYRVCALDGSGPSDPAISLVTETDASGTANPSISFACSKGHTYYVYVASIADSTTKPASFAYSWSFSTTTSTATAVVIVSPTQYQRDPAAVGVTVLNMTPGETVAFSVNGTSVGSLAADDTGTVVGSLTVNLALTAGTYILTATGATSGNSGTATFQLLENPLSRPTAPSTDTPVSPPVQVGVQRWVFQDPMPGGLGTLVFPFNPEKASSPYAKLQVVAEHTVAQDGTPVIWQGVAQAQTMQFSGYTQDQTFFNAVLAFQQSNRKFYWIDHRGRTWTVALTSWGEDRRVVRPQGGTDTSWAMNYTGQMTIFAGPM